MGSPGVGPKEFGRGKSEGVRLHGLAWGRSEGVRPWGPKEFGLVGEFG